MIWNHGGKRGRVVVSSYDASAWKVPPWSALQRRKPGRGRWRHSGIQLSGPIPGRLGDDAPPPIPSGRQASRHAGAEGGVGDIYGRSMHWLSPASAAWQAPIISGVELSGPIPGRLGTRFLTMPRRPSRPARQATSATRCGRQHGVASAVALLNRPVCRRRAAVVGIPKLKSEYGRSDPPRPLTAENGMLRHAAQSLAA